MKVAVFHNLPSGGAKRALYGHVKYLTGAGHTVDVFVPSTAREDFLPLKELANTVEVFPVRKTLSGKLYSYARYIPPEKHALRDIERAEQEAAERVNSLDHDIVLSEQSQFTMSPFFLKYLRKKCVYYCQQPWRMNEAVMEEFVRRTGFTPAKSRLRKRVRAVFFDRMPRVDRENASHARYVLANSYFSRESILRSYGQNAHVSYLGVDTSVFRPTGEMKEHMVLSVGMCRPQKGFETVVRSVGMIDARVRPRLVLVSNTTDPDWKRYLERVILETEVECEILDNVSNEELVSLYGRAKVVAYAPYLEPFGLVPLEAMACGTPVVGVREGGVRESIVDGETGLLAERDDEEFSRSLSRLLDNDGERESMGRRGITAVNSFWTLAHAGMRLRSHLEKAMNTL